MSYNLDMPYPKTADQNYTMVPFLDQCDAFCQYNPQAGTSYPLIGAEEPAIANSEVSSSSDIKTRRRQYPLTDEDSGIKKLLRRIQNREAATRCRRKKMERIFFLRETLNRMYNRCQELRQNINAVEAEVRNLKAAGYGQHFTFGQYQAMKNGAFEDSLPNLCPCNVVADKNQDGMENLYEMEAGNQY